MAIAIKNDKAQDRFIIYTVNGVAKRAFFKAFEERIIDEIDDISQVVNKESTAKRNAVENNPNSFSAQLVKQSGGFIQDVSTEERFAVRVLEASNTLQSDSFVSESKSTVTATRDKNANPIAAGTVFYDASTKKTLEQSGWFSFNSNSAVARLSGGRVVVGHDLSTSLGATQLTINLVEFFDDYFPNKYRIANPIATADVKRAIVTDNKFFNS